MENGSANVHASVESNVCIIICKSSVLIGIYLNFKFEWIENESFTMFTEMIQSNISIIFCAQTRFNHVVYVSIIIFSRTLNCKFEAEIWILIFLGHLEPALISEWVLQFTMGRFFTCVSSQFDKNRLNISVYGELSTLTHFASGSSA